MVVMNVLAALGVVRVDISGMDAPPMKEGDICLLEEGVGGGGGGGAEVRITARRGEVGEVGEVGRELMAVNREFRRGVVTVLSLWGLLRVIVATCSVG